MDKIFKIGFDFDGVLADHHNTKIKLANANGLKLEPWQTNSNIIKQFLSLDSYREMQKKLYYGETPSAPAVPFIKELFDMLSRHNLFLISARSSACQNFARLWLSQNLDGKIPENNINFCEDEKIKVDRINSISPDIFIDDKIKILHGINSGIKKVLFDPDYINTKLDINEDVVVIHSLKDFLKTVKI